MPQSVSPDEPGRAWVLVLGLILATSLGCADDAPTRNSGGGGGSGGIAGSGGIGGTAGLTIAPISDQQVLRNTLVPRTIELEVTVEGYSGTFEVTLTSTAESVFPSMSRSCNTASPCAFSFVPAADQNADARIDVEVSADGNEAQTSFEIQVSARMVRNVTDAAPPDMDSLRHAIAESVAGDVVGFDIDGSADATISLGELLVIRQPLTVEGPNVGSVTIQNGEGYRAIEITDSASVSIDGVDFNGVRPLEGGLIVVTAGASLALSNSDLVDGVAAQGGAILSAGDLMLENCTFTGNAAPDGGAVRQASPGSLTIRDTVFDANGLDPIDPAAVGGGVTTNTTTTLERVDFLRNQAGLGGGLLVGTDAVVTMTDGALGSRLGTENGGNRAVNGGGAYVVGGGALSIASVRVELNQATRGAGFYLDGVLVPEAATLDITTSQINDNFATEFGGGIFAQGCVVTMDTASAIGPENEAGIENGGGGIWVTGGADVTGVPANRVNGNRAGPMGAESNINTDPGG